jgi:hypothetical protein
MDYNCSQEILRSCLLKQAVASGIIPPSTGKRAMVVSHQTPVPIQNPNPHSQARFGVVRGVRVMIFYYAICGVFFDAEERGSK